MKKRITLLLLLFLFNGIQFINAQDYTATKSFGKKELAVREVRRAAITANIGWKSLTGIGVSYQQYVGKQMGVDLGLGLSLTGVKFGGRFRYLFMEKNFSPFVSAGFMYGMGLGDVEMEYITDGNSFSYRIGSSPFGQITGGIEYLSNGGFLIMANIGYAILLNDGNYEIIHGTPTAEELNVMNAMFGSGMVFEFSIGYAFGGKK